MSEENGKKDTMGEELRAIRKVAGAIENLGEQSKRRVLYYVLEVVDPSRDETLTSDEAKKVAWASAGR